MTVMQHEQWDGNLARNFTLFVYCTTIRCWAMCEQFKVPVFCKKNAHSIKGVPTFDVSQLQVKERIGHGSFGEVYTTEFKEARQLSKRTVVIKKAIQALDEDERKLFLKEVALLHDLKHDNVVKLKGVCYKPCALMLEYLCFSFIPFGENARVSSLADLLLHADAEYNFEGFEDLVVFAAKDILRGLRYLHANGVAHRDLKPANVLVSNQHYSLLSKDQIASHFKLQPVVCKLTDFGESRSANVQTNTVLASETQRVDRGTAVFMSPEILVKDGSKFNQVSLNDLMVSDIWSLGMTFFTMINPNLKCPYLLEIRSCEKNIQTQEDVYNFVGNRLRQRKRPMSDIKYNLSHATIWSCLEEVYIGCTSFDSDMRFSLRDVEEVLNGKYDVDNTCDVVKMKVTQTTAIEQMDHQVAIKLSVENDNIEIQSPEPLVTNDGSNACAFLSVKIADTIIHELGAHISDIASIAEMIEEVIWFLPQKINGKRDMTRFYDVSEAYSILWKATVLNSEYDFFEELPFADCIYSFDSRRRLHERLCILGQADFTAIFSSVPYILVIACIGGRALIIDTHTGSLVVGRDKSHSTWKSLCLWLWKRLQCAGVQQGTGQSLSRLTPRKR